MFSSKSPGLSLPGAATAQRSSVTTPLGGARWTPLSGDLSPVTSTKISPCQQMLETRMTCLPRTPALVAPAPDRTISTTSVIKLWATVYICDQKDIEIPFASHCPPAIDRPDQPGVILAISMSTSDSQKKSLRPCAAEGASCIFHFLKS